MISIEKKGRRVEIRSSQPLPGLRTAIPGAYETVAGYWTVPLSLETCRLLQEKYGKRLVIGNELKRWAIGVQQSRAYMSELARSDDAELEVLPTAAPALFAAMQSRTYQRVGARFIADNSATLLADDPGLGKTLIAMGGILEAGVPGPYLIVAPKTASDTVWRREILRWLPREHKPIIMPEYGYQREHKLRLTRYGPHTWVIVHPEMVRVQASWICACGVATPVLGRNQRKLKCEHIKDRKTKKSVVPAFPRLFEVEWGAVVVDESHESLIVRGKPTQRRRGLEMLKVRGDGIRIAQSGSPFDSKPHQLWGTLNWLDPKTYSAFNRWAELFWQRGGYTGYEIGEFRHDREKLLWDSIAAVALRRTKAEVAPDLPTKMEIGTPLNPRDTSSPVGIWLEMDGPQSKAYQDMEKLSITQLESGRLEAITALAELTRLKQLATCYGDMEIRNVWQTDDDGHRFKGPKEFYKPVLPSNKFDWIVENLEEWGFPSSPIGKVVIVSFYTGILECFQKGLETHFKTKVSRPLCTSITGRTPAEERRAVIDQFNKPGGPHVMMLNVKAGGTAITIDSADRMIFISETRNPMQQSQAEDRIHRVSNPRQCMYYYLRSLGTVDVGTALLNQEALQDTHRLLDTRRGVQYMRKVMELSRR